MIDLKYFNSFLLKRTDDVDEKHHDSTINEEYFCSHCDDQDAFERLVITIILLVTLRKNIIEHMHVCLNEMNHMLQSIDHIVQNLTRKYSQSKIILQKLNALSQDEKSKIQ